MISVAMAVYNGEKYIEKQLDSILKQTVLPDEVIICNDCSNETIFFCRTRMIYGIKIK